MNDHNLDDLIIDNIEPNSSKTKSFLTIVALLIVFLIVGIILAKIYTNESSNATLTLEENNSELIAPELILQAPSKVAKVKEEPSLSTIIEQEIKAPKAPGKKIKEVTPEPKPVKVKKETVQVTQESTQKPKVPKVTKPKVVEPIVKEPEVPKHVVQPVAPKPVKVVTEPKEIPKTVSDISYYIQVGSFTQNPSSRFLSVIKNSGFSYTITKANSQGIKKLLIGSYPSRTSVDTALIQLRDRINKKAFVVKK
ncbi:MAG: hypothetical protein DRG09_05590 [Epsilonproteobacteria bacterium]|nr:MAG: hypothetical protein DRG09_05590 [Campylobacterota bacterium]